MTRSSRTALKKEVAAMEAQQGDEYQLRLRVLASLASIPSLAALPAREQHALVNAARDAGIGASLFDQFSTLPSPDGMAERQWKPKGMVPVAWVALALAHPWARQYINELLDGKMVPRILLAQREKSGTLVLSRGPGRWGVVESNPEGPVYELLADLESAVRVFPFPFRRCPDCQAIFVPGKRQKYCSRACTTRGSDAARRTTPKRREYMRRFMANKRQRARKPKRSRATSAFLSQLRRGVREREQA